MPKSSQALYFHLGMDADDDGFIHPGQIMRAGGYQSDDLKILLAKRFLLSFESGVVVIKHWLIHNLIQKDRHIQTRYQEELKRLFIKENKAYTDKIPLKVGSVNKMLTQVRLGKGRLLAENEFSAEEVNNSVLKEVLAVPVNEDGDAVSREPRKKADTSYLAIFELWGAYPANWKLNRTQIQAAKNLLKERGTNQVAAALRFHGESKEHEFCPQITSPYDLDSKWSKLFAFKKKYG